MTGQEQEQERRMNGWEIYDDYGNPSNDKNGKICRFQRQKMSWETRVDQKERK